MPNLTDIINAATPGPWLASHDIDPRYDSSVKGGDGEYIASFGEDYALSRADARYIAYFDPTHIALMLAYEQACDRYFDAQADYRNCGDRQDFTRYYARVEQTRTEAGAARDALADYRKERTDE